MSHIERLNEAALMQAIEKSADVEAAKLRRAIGDCLKVQKAHADSYELEQLQNRLAAATDRARQASLRLAELERRQAGAGTVKTINLAGDRAEIVIHYLVSENKRVSFTRHVHWTGSSWTGRSTLTSAFVTYQVPTMSWQREAA